MPSLPSSTLSNPDLLTSLVQKRVDNGDYVNLLDCLLAVCHRDDGQYTTLVGWTCSIVDALRMVEALHKDNAALKARLAKLTNG